ncbi:MAG: CsgG/HfaB family protein, partial [Bacteroidota bacterium]
MKKQLSTLALSLLAAVLFSQTVNLGVLPAKTTGNFQATEVLNKWTDALDKFNRIAVVKRPADFAAADDAALLEEGKRNGAGYLLQVTFDPALPQARKHGEKHQSIDPKTLKVVKEWTDTVILYNHRVGAAVKLTDISTGGIVFSKKLSAVALDNFKFEHDNDMQKDPNLSLQTALGELEKKFLAAARSMFPVKIQLGNPLEQKENKCLEIVVQGGENWDLKKNDRLYVTGEQEEVEANGKKLAHSNMIARLKVKDVKAASADCKVKQGSIKLGEALKSGKPLQVVSTVLGEGDDRRPIVGLLDFKFMTTMSSDHRGRIEQGIEEMFLESSMFRLVERQNLEALLKERTAQKKAEYVDAESLAEQGKALGAQYMVEGKVLNANLLEYTVPDTGKVKVNEGRPYKMFTSDLTLHIRMVDVATGKIVVEQQLTGTDQYDRFMNGKVFRNYMESVESSVANLKKNFLKAARTWLPLEGVTIVEILEEKKEKVDRVLLNGGLFNGIRDNDALKVVQVVYEEVDGQKLKREVEVADLWVKEVDEEYFSECSVRKGEKKI